MKTFKCMGLHSPGNFSVIIYTMIIGMLIVLPLQAQESAVSLPFKESSNYLAEQFWSPEEFEMVIIQDQSAEEKKSPSKAFFYSLILPGTGEAYVGEKVQSKIFLAIELVAWGLVVANYINVANRESDYKNFAVQHASVYRVGKNDQYWIDIGKFDRIF